MTARVVCLVALVAAVAHAQPERRAVAVIDLSRDDAAKKLRSAIEETLDGHWALKLPQNRFDRELEGEFLDEDGGTIAGAALDARAADEALAQGDSARARTKAHDGLAKLTNAGPTAGATLRADLAFALGIADLIAHDKKAAAAAFALAARFDPMRRLDPGQYMDEIVRAYDAAKLAVAPKVALSVAGAGRVWIDGLLVGTSPNTFQVGAGLHMVQLADFNRVTRGALVDAPGATVAIPDDPASEELQVRRARVALARAPDATARAGTLAQLTDLVHVRDAVLIAKDEAGKLTAQTVTFKDGALTYSKPREVEGVSPGDILEPLSGPKPPDEPKEPPRPPVKPRTDPVGPREGEPKWYRKRWVQATGVGFLIGLAAVIVVVAREPHFVTLPMGGKNTQ